MYLYISESSNKPIYVQLVSQLREMILTQKLTAQEPLPSIRTLAKDLQISVITTKRAYEDLEKEGLIYSIPGKGFFVCNRNIQIIKEKRIQMIETKLQTLIDECKSSELSFEDLVSMIEVLWE